MIKVGVQGRGKVVFKAPGLGVISSHKVLGRTAISKNLFDNLNSNQIKVVFIGNLTIGTIGVELKQKRGRNIR